MSSLEEVNTAVGCEGSEGISNVVRDGDWAIIKMHDDQDNIVNISKRQQQKIGRNKISVGPLIGEPYGSIFDINGKVISKLEGEVLDAHNVQVPSTYKPEGDNRSFSDTNTAQKLTPEEIEQMRAEGATGNDIISSLIANSDSWNNKTEFSQEKWLRRKQKKYTQRIRILKCSPVSICDAYYRKNPSKMFHLRSDNLGTILSYGGIYSGGRPLIFDDMLGLIVGSAAYQMRGNGAIFGVYFGQQPHFDLVDRLNLSDVDHSIIRSVPSQQIADASNFATHRGLLSTASDLEAFKLHDRAVISEKYRRDAESRGVPENRSEFKKEPKEKVNSRPHQSSGRQMEDLLAIRSSLREGFHSLVIATGFHPLGLLKQALPLLRPSSPIVIYCEFREPLVECFVHLQHRSLAIKLQLVDPWMREFQVLAERCHPQMSVNMTSGCILTGVVVSNKTERTVAAEDVHLAKRAKTEIAETK